jgi:hypothetical protein
MLNFNEVYEAVLGIHGKVHLWPFLITNNFLFATQVNIKE